MNTFMKYVATAASASVLLSSGSAWAATDTGNLDVTITIQAACTLNSVDAASNTHTFGTAGAQSINGNVSVTCNNTVPYTVAIGSGLHLSAGNQRQVQSGTDLIIYTLNKSGGGGQWGTAGTAADTSFNFATDLNGTGTGAATLHGYNIDYTLVGTEAPGTYTDTALVTLEF